MTASQNASLLTPLNEEPAQRATGRLATVETLLIVLVFFVHAGWPPPEVNEPHYLGKAKQYWDPDWCQGDFFLETADAHQTFYWCFGWLTLLLPLPAVAWVGRLLTWTLLAAAWQRLSYTLTPRPLASVLGAALFVGLLERCNLAGEWAVGGVEAKGFAYAFVFFALAEIVLNRWRRAWLLLGVASAWHVLVGGWAVVAAGFVWLGDGRQRASWKEQWPGLLAGGAIALVGLAPALWLTRGVDPAIVARANEIYVFGRLPHHLALHTLKSEELQWRLMRNTLPLATFAALCWLLPASSGKRRVANFIFATILISLVGAAISLATLQQRELAAGLLRYYWYRLYDVALPMGVGLFAVALIAEWLPQKRNQATLLLLVTLLFPVGHLARVVWSRTVDPRPPADRKVDHASDWRAACEWARDNTPGNAVFLTPRGSQSFKWHADRCEVVNQKDIPQDAAGIVEWQSRLDDLYPEVKTEQGLRRKAIERRTEGELIELAKRYGARYLIAPRYAPLNFPLVYENPTYVIFELRPGDPE